MDLYHSWGSDFILSATGDLLLVGGSDATTQRVLRRLLTNLGDYIWQLNYGAGLPAMVGNPASVAAIRGRIRGQMLQEVGVAQNPPPRVTVSASPDNTVYAQVTYADATTGATQTVSATARGPTTLMTTPPAQPLPAVPAAPVPVGNQFVLDSSTLDSGDVLG